MIAAHLSVLARAGLGHATLVASDSPLRGDVEEFIAEAYRVHYNARLHSFLPDLLAYHDATGALVAAVGLRMAADGPLFVEQYLEEPAEVAISRRLGAGAARAGLAEVGNFAAAGPGYNRVVIPHITHLLHHCAVRWVLFTATRQLRNAFGRLQLQPVELAAADPSRLRADATDWGRYYDAHPHVMGGDISSGHAFLLRLARERELAQPQAPAMPALRALP